MLQEIIVYLILLVTAIHLLHQSILFFKPAKANKSGSSCGSGGSCSNCSLKIDLDSIHPDHTDNKVINSKYIQI